MKLLNKKPILQYSMYAIIGASMLMLIAFTEKKQAIGTCQKIIIRIDSDFDNHFINEADVTELMTLHASAKIIGETFKEIDLKILENRVRKHEFVQNAEVYRDIRGNLIVDVVQAKPIARVASGRGQDFYIDESGKIIPVSERFTTRVPIIIENGKGMLKTLDFKKDTTAIKFLTFLQKIESDPFWKAQIATIELMKNGEMILHPQVTKQEILFGTPDQVEDKLSRLMIFYKKILPSKGWNEYTTVNVKYKDQIICN